MAVTSHRAIDIAIGVAALAVSAISLWVAIGTEEANRKMVSAATWPLLQLETGNNDDDNKPRITMSLVNAGVGPARVETLEVIWNGKAYATHGDYLAACCGFREAFYTPDNQVQTPVSSAPVSGHALRAGEQRMFLSMPLGKDNIKVWTALDTARFRTKFRACYCSVFDECWESDLTGVKPTPVAQCKAPAVSYRE